MADDPVPIVPIQAPAPVVTIPPVDARSEKLNPKPQAEVVFEAPAVVDVADVKDASDSVSVPLPLWILNHDGVEATISAENEAEARAAWNDHRKLWPSPREVTCVRKEV